MEENNTANGVAWLGLVVAIIALILAWSAFNRAGQDVVPTVVDGFEEVGEEVEEAAQNTEEAAREGTADALENVAETAEEGAAEARSDEDGPNN